MEDIKYELPVLPKAEHKMPETVLIELPLPGTNAGASIIDTPTAAPSPKKSRLGAKLATAYKK